MQYGYIVGLSAVLATTVFSQTSDWDAKLKEVTAYDKYTERLTYKDGTWKKPKKDVLKALTTMKAQIQDSARRMGVDPRAVAGAILAENSLNVSVSDGVQDFLVRNGLAKNGSVMGKKFTFGWGQLYMDAAREGEKVAAKLENRKTISDKELQDALLVPEKAVYYVAAVIRKVQDDYLAQGIDIRNKPAILATLYNLGKSETKAKEAKAAGRTPRENFFGLFVDRYLPDIEGAVGKPGASAVVAKKATVKAVPAVKPVAKVAAKPVVKVADSAPVVKAVKEKPKKFQLVLTDDLPVYQAPPKCVDSQNDMTGLIERYKSYSYSKVTSVLKASEAVKVVAPAIDCEANAWVLVRSGDQMGWAAQKDFDAKSEKGLAEVEDCKSKGDPKCKASVKEATKEFWVDDKIDAKSNTLLLNPIAASGKGHFRTMDTSCRLVSSNESGAVKEVTGWMSANAEGLNDRSIQKDPKEVLVGIDATEKVLNEKLAEINQKFNLNGDFDSPSNPYQLVTSLMNLKTQIKTCREQVDSGLTCSTRFDSMPDILKAMKIQESPSYSELQNEDMTIQGYMYVSVQNLSQKFFAVSKEEFKTKDQIVSGLNDCLGKLKAFAKTFAINPNGTPAPQSTPSGKMGNSSFASRVDEIQTVVSSIQSAPESEVSKVIPTVTRYEKACRAFATLVTEKPTTEDKTTNASSCETFPIANMVGTFKSIHSALARKLIVGDEALAANTLQQIMDSIIPSYWMQGKVAQMEPGDGVGAYCPNKTAEFIENLLKNNHCIKMIHMPSRWIVSRLNEYSDQVIYRPFEDEDRYAIEFVGGCSK